MTFSVAYEWMPSSELKRHRNVSVVQEEILIQVNLPAKFNYSAIEHYAFDAYVHQLSDILLLLILYFVSM